MNTSPSSPVTRIRLLRRIVVVAALAVFAGCATSGSNSSSKTASSMDEAREALGKGRAYVSTAVATLNGLLSSQGDLRRGFDGLESVLGDNRSAADKIGDKLNSMRTSWAAHFSKWQKEVQGIQNAEVRALAEQRRAAAFENFQRAIAQVEGARGAYQEFVQTLSDIRGFLARDITPGALRTITPTIQKASDSAKALQQRLDDAVAELERVAKEFSSQAQASAPVK